MEEYNLSYSKPLPEHLQALLSPFTLSDQKANSSHSGEEWPEALSAEMPWPWVYEDEKATSAEPACLSTVGLSPRQDVLHLLQDELRLDSWVKDYPFLLFFLFRPFNLILKAWEQELETWSILFLVYWWQSKVSA